MNPTLVRDFGVALCLEISMTAIGEIESDRPAICRRRGSRSSRVGVKLRPLACYTHSLLFSTESIW